MRKVILNTFVSIIYLLVSSCSGDNLSPNMTQTAPRSVKIYEAHKEEVQQQIEGFGNLSFGKKADITSAVDGIIVQMSVEEGEHVEAGEQIGKLFNIQLEIRTRQAEAALYSAESAYSLAETQYKESRLQVESRMLSIEKSGLNLIQKELELENQRENLENERELLSLGGVSEDEASAMELAFSALETEVNILKKEIAIQRIGFRDIDIINSGYSLPETDAQRQQILLDINSMTLESELMVAEARVRSAQTECDSAAALLSETLVRTPIGGIVGARYMEEGERVSATDKLYTIFDSKKVELIFSIPEEIGVLIKPGQIADISLDAVKDREFEAVISRISPTIDTNSGNITIRAGLENNEGIFRPGMFSRFSLSYGSPMSLIRIPVETLLERDGNKAELIKVSGGHAYPQKVELGSSNNGVYDVINGIKEGDKIILSPSPLIREGDPVNVH